MAEERRLLRDAEAAQLVAALVDVAHHLHHVVDVAAADLDGATHVLQGDGLPAAELFVTVIITSGTAALPRATSS